MLIPDVQEHVVTDLDIIEKGWWRESYLYHGIRLLVSKISCVFGALFARFPGENAVGSGAILGPGEAMSIRPCRYGGVFSFRMRKPSDQASAAPHSQRVRILAETSQRPEAIAERARRREKRPRQRQRDYARENRTPHPSDGGHPNFLHGGGWLRETASTCRLGTLLLRTLLLRRGWIRHIGVADWPSTLFRGLAASALSIDLMTDRAKNLQPPGSSSTVYDVPAGKPVRSCALLSCRRAPPGDKAGAGGPRGAITYDTRSSRFLVYLRIGDYVSPYSSVFRCWCQCLEML